MIEFNVFLMIWNKNGTLTREEILNLLKPGIEAHFDAVFQDGSGIFTLFKSKKYFESLYACMNHSEFYIKADEEISEISKFFPSGFSEKVKKSDIEAKIMIEPVVDCTQFDFLILDKLSDFCASHKLPIYVMSNDL